MRTFICLSLLTGAALFAQDTEIQSLTAWMTGTFDTWNQVREDEASKAPYQHVRAMLKMRPFAMKDLDGGQAIYVEQSLEGQEDRPYRQRVYFVTRQGGAIKNLMYKFKDPAAVLGAYDRPELLQKLTSAGIAHEEGCDITWTKSGDQLYKGCTEPRACKSTLRGAAYLMSNAELRPGSLVSLDQGFGADGAHKWGPPPGTKGHLFVKREFERNLQQLYFETQSAKDHDIVWRITGAAYSYQHGKRPIHLFDVDGFNIRARIETPEKDGWFLATREIVFYKDPKTGEVLNEWTNPMNGVKNEVFPIANDPVNSRMAKKDGALVAVSMDGKRSFGPLPMPKEINDHYVWTADVFPFYPLPQFEKNYTAAELFDFYVPKSARYSKDAAVPAMVSWTRVGPWVPWMGVDKYDGAIIYHARSQRMESFELLPDWMKKLVREKYPVYATAPKAVDPAQPNATSFTAYYQEVERRKQSAK
jgi:Protein of unknown function (DUF1838)/CpeT/CpcT family (DUF1001)